MKRALVFTIYNRPGYFRAALQSWVQKVDFSNWKIVFRLEPSEHLDPQIELIHEQMLPTGADYQVIVNPDLLGVLLHPWVAFETLFLDGFDFVVRTEDDLLVSNDVLRYFAWASERFADDSEVATVHGYSKTWEPDPFHVRLSRDFNPLVFGTWADRWREYIGPTWDKDYSTYNGQPGVNSGWDWNLNTRVLPRLDKFVALPDQSRVQNIGMWGTHSLPENFEQAPGWQSDYGRGEFWCNDERPMVGT